MGVLEAHDFVMVGRLTGERRDSDRVTRLAPDFDSVVETMGENSRSKPRASSLPPSDSSVGFASTVALLGTALYLI
jgi:hypothetical protein